MSPHRRLVSLLLAAAGVVVAVWFSGIMVMERMPCGVTLDGYSLVATFPHDPFAYCQGLLFSDGDLYESTGRHGASSVRRVDLETGKVEQKRCKHSVNPCR